MKRKSNKAKLLLTKETVRKLSKDKLPKIKGGSASTDSGVSITGISWFIGTCAA